MENSKATFSIEQQESVNQSTLFLEEQSDFFHFTNSCTFTKPTTVANLPKYPSKEYKKLAWGQNTYEGNILADNLHGTGFYFAQQNGKKYFYDGLFYVNKLEGYSQVFYENGTHFQGLFKYHQRFGPGVLTYPNGEQDVGFWNGFKISRLSCSISNDLVPMLSNTQAGKTKLLCTRYLVPISEEDTNFVKTTLTNVGASEEVINSADEVFNVYIRNPRSMFFHKKYYNEEFYAGQPSCFIKVLANEEESNDLWKCSDKEYKTKAERIEKLKEKIEEIKDTLQTFVVVKRNLLGTVSKCQACCDWSSYVPEEQEIPEDFCEPYYSTSAPAKSSLQPMTSFNPFNDSLATLKSFNDDSSPQPTDTSFIASNSISTHIMDYICPCDEHELSDGLQHLEEQLRNISNEELFYRNIHDELSKKVSNLVRSLEPTNEDVKVKLVEVKELWAWNNDDLLISMQKHCFKHRQSEDMVNFDVSNVILGSRNLFGHAGIQEKICKKFLQACSKGKKDFIRDCITNKQVDPNLADSRGNTGIFFATVSNQHDVISLLTNSGANISQLNDEQLSPLCLNLLRYISLINNCSDWEKAFLNVEKTCEIPNLPEWYRINSVQSLTSTLTTCSSCNSQIRYPNLRILNLLRRMTNMDIRTNVAKPVRTSPYIFDLNCQPTKRVEVSTKPFDNIKKDMEATHLTIAALLEYGANPNCGDVPYPPLILSLFTENPELVREVIKANADLSTVIEENLSCLHIAASLFPSFENSSIFRVLVRYGCNANLLTSPSHWADRRKAFTGTIPDDFEILDEGKNALHLLCMRMDFHDDQSNFFCSIAKPLVMDTNLDPTKTYLGHTPLSLAVISGNIRLLQCLLKSQVFDPYQYLDYGMGNILTLYTLKRFEKVAPLAECKAVLTALIEMDLNPLNQVGDYENAVVFAEEGDKFFDTNVQKDEKVKTKTKAPKENKKSQTFAMKQFLKDLTRQAIIKQVQIQVTRILYEFIEEGTLHDYEILATLSYQYLTPEVAAANLRTLFEYQVLEKDRLDETIIKSLLEYTDAHKKLPKKGAKSKANKPKPELKNKGKTKKPVEEEKMPVTVDIQKTDFQCSVNFKFTRHKYLEAAGLEMDKTKYRTCFHCLHSRNKELKLCPVCQMIYFCSSQCNNANIKLKTQHGCNVSFYDFPETKIEELTRGLCLKDIVQATRKKRFKRLQEMREIRLEEEGRKLKELWQSDVYGTKFMQIRPLLDKLVAKKYKNVNWNVALLKEMLDRQFQQSPGDKSMYNLDTLVLKLNSRQLSQLLMSKDKDEGTVRTKQSWSTRRSSLGENTLRSIILQASFNRRDDEKSLETPCTCSEKVRNLKSRPTLKSATRKDKAKTNQQLQHYVTHKYSFNSLAKSDGQHMGGKIKKLKKIPSRYQKFVETLAAYFPDDDFSLWLLPYACCSEGQLYYKFCYNEDLFKESYSLT